METDKPGFDAVAKEFQDHLRAEMNDRGSRLFGMGAPSPEQLRVLARMDRYVSELRLLYAASSSRDDFEVPRVHDLFRTPLQDMDVLTAWVVADDLKFEVLAQADDLYLTSLLQQEAASARQQPEQPGIHWTDLFRAEELSASIDAFAMDPVPDAERRRARSCLHALYLRRAEAGNLSRAQQRTRAHYLVRWTQVLTPLVLAFLLSMYMAATSSSAFWPLLTAGLAGALGSTLSGALQVRGLTRIAALRSVRAALYTQPLVGATASLFLYALLESHLLVLPGTTSSGTPGWAALATYGFLAGFSEPFFLGAVQRIASGAGRGGGATNGGNVDKP
jgi:hypothetical protein